MPHVLPATHEAIIQAAARLRGGGVVGFPTETVYGLGASTFDASAVALVYELKGRPFNNPLIAHVRDWEQARTELFELKRQGTDVRNEWLHLGEQLARRFWPGPLTVVAPKSERVPMRATAGLATIAVRSPAHRVARRLLEQFGGPISAPSANHSGHVSPTTAQHVAHDFADVEDLLILDGGPCEVGIESTVLDVTSTPPRVLRSGSVTIEQLRVVIGEVTAPPISEQAASPGTAARHYAPSKPAELVSREKLPERLRGSREPLAVLTIQFESRHVVLPHRAIVMPAIAEDYARSLYGSLRDADELVAARILIEEPPRDNEIWRVIHDRLARATAAR